MSSEALEAEIQSIARRVRRWRDEAELTLNELAQRSGVATSTIHKIESFQMVPSIAVLLKIARGLNRSARDFVSDSPPAERVRHLPAGKRQHAGSSRTVLVERLSGDLVDPEVEMWRVTVQPGCGSGREALAYRGEELVLCEEGEVHVTVGEERYRLGPGDVLHFKASTPHSWRNDGDRPARFLVLGTLASAVREVLPPHLSRGPSERVRAPRTATKERKR